MFINGEQATQLPVTDRGLNYGDGCFTTIKVSDGKLCLWPAHLQRMKSAVERLQIPFEDWQTVEQLAVAQAREQQLAVMKIVITRGSGGRGYSPTGADKPNWILTLHPFPANYPQWQQQGVELKTSSTRLGHQPLLAGIKHLNRLEQVLVKQELENLDCDELLVCDQEGMMIGVSSGNLFWCENGRYYTPDLSLCGIEGVTRNHLLVKMGGNGVKVSVVRASPEALRRADSAFICNSLMEVVPVRQFNGIEYDIEPVRLIQNL